MDSNKSMPPLGNSGDDSVDLLDEWLKQHSSTTPVTTIHEPINQQYCGQRLPCGICRMTMMQCPLSLMQPTWSWSSSTATNQTGGEA